MTIYLTGRRPFLIVCFNPHTEIKRTSDTSGWSICGVSCFGNTKCGCSQTTSGLPHPFVRFFSSSSFQICIIFILLTINLVYGGHHPRAFRRCTGYPHLIRAYCSSCWRCREGVCTEGMSRMKHYANFSGLTDSSS